MKKLFVGMTTVCLSLGTLLGSAQPSYARTILNQEAQPAADEQPLTEESDAIPLRALGIDYRDLRGPSDGMRATFTLPATWQYREGTALELRYTAFISSRPSSEAAASTLKVTLNGNQIASVPLTEVGEQRVVLPIPQSALVLPAGATRHDLQIALDSGLDCVTDQQVRVVIRPDSQLLLPHTIGAPKLELAALPWPLVQQSFLPDRATLVVPNSPTAGELQAALNVAAGLGQSSGGKLDLNVVSADQLTPELREGRGLVFIGTPAAFPMLSEAQLAAPVTDGNFAVAGAQAGDGIIQLVPSPWNPTGALLVVGGNDEAAVAKAGQAFGLGGLRGTPENLALVAGVNPPVAAPSGKLDQSFAELGYAARRIAGRGENSTSFRFDLPANQRLTDDATLNLVFNHSALLDYGRSSAQVLVNGQPIKSLRFSDSTTRADAMELKIPQSALRPGSNDLTVNANFAPISRCVVTDPSDLWMQIWPESRLNAPLDSAGGASGSGVDLSNYAAAFSLSSAANTTAFVIEHQSPAALASAIDLAFAMGAQTPGKGVAFGAAFDDNVPQTLLDTSSLVVVGRPSQIGLMEQLNPMLPAPFEAGKDSLGNQGGRVVYRTAEGTNAGYLQVAAGPWGGRPVLAVFGSSDDALRQATEALASGATPLTGRVALVESGQVTQVAPGAAAPVVAQPQPTAATPAVDVAALSSAPERRTWWLVPGMILAIVGILAIAGLAANTTLRQRRTLRTR